MGWIAKYHKLEIKLTGSLFAAYGQPSKECKYDKDSSSVCSWNSFFVGEEKQWRA